MEKNNKAAKKEFDKFLAKRIKTSNKSFFSHTSGSGSLPENMWHPLITRVQRKHSVKIKLLEKLNGSFASLFHCRRVDFHIRKLSGTGWPSLAILSEIAVPRKTATLRTLQQNEQQLFVKNLMILPRSFSTLREEITKRLIADYNAVLKTPLVSREWLSNIKSQANFCGKVPGEMWETADLKVWNLQ